MLANKIRFWSLSQLRVQRGPKALSQHVGRHLSLSASLRRPLSVSMMYLLWFAVFDTQE